MELRKERADKTYSDSQVASAAPSRGFDGPAWSTSSAEGETLAVTSATIPASPADANYFATLWMCDVAEVEPNAQA
eukprot:7243776-Pyramimonas_sp.AAC.1